MQQFFFTTIQDKVHVHNFIGELISCRELFVDYTSCNSFVSSLIMCHCLLHLMKLLKSSVIQGTLVGGGEVVESRALDNFFTCTVKMPVYI